MVWLPVLSFAMLVHFPVAGSYFSHSLMPELPLQPPTTYRKSFNVVTPERQHVLIIKLMIKCVHMVESSSRDETVFVYMYVVQNILYQSHFNDLCEFVAP